MAMMFILAMLTTLTVQAAADKTALDAAVSEAETYNSSILESNPKQAEVLTMLINSCKTVLNDADATQEDVDFATKFMNESVNQCKIAVAQANYAAAISEAEEYLATIKENYPAQAEKLNNLINNAKAMEGTSMEVLEFFTQVLTKGLQQIKMEIAHADLAAAIADAEAYMTTIQESNPSVAEAMQMFINAAKQVQADDSYTQADLEFATAFMKELVVQAKEAVTTGVAAARAAAGLAAKYYDLQGRRLSQPSRAGVYINNGVKVAIK
jgi:uncharacterized tellurite resistance protein B-like protein